MLQQLAHLSRPEVVLWGGGGSCLCSDFIASPLAAIRSAPMDLR